MTIFDAIRMDSEAGTPGPWKTGQCSWDEDSKDVRYTLHDVKVATPADARRIARVPDLEKIALAAEEAIEYAHNAVIEAYEATKHIDGAEELYRKRVAALAAFRKAAGGE